MDNDDDDDDDWACLYRRVVVNAMPPVKKRERVDDFNSLLCVLLCVDYRWDYGLTYL